MPGFVNEQLDGCDSTVAYAAPGARQCELVEGDRPVRSYGTGIGEITLQLTAGGLKPCKVCDDG